MAKTNLDQKRRSKQKWERGRGAPRKGNPRYKPVIRNGRKVYILRPKKWSVILNKLKQSGELKENGSRWI